MTAIASKAAPCVLADGGGAMHDLAQQLVDAAEGDNADMGASATGQANRPAVGLPL